MASRLRHVKAGGKDDVPLDDGRGLLHLVEQLHVAHDAGGVSELAAGLLEPHDRADNGALHDVRELTNLREGSTQGPLVDHLQTQQTVYHNGGSVSLEQCPTAALNIIRMTTSIRERKPEQVGRAP